MIVIQSLRCMASTDSWRIECGSGLLSRAKYKCLLTAYRSEVTAGYAERKEIHQKRDPRERKESVYVMPIRIQVQVEPAQICAAEDLSSNHAGTFW